MNSTRIGNLNLIKLMGTVFTVIGAALGLIGVVLLFVLRNANMELYWLPTAILCTIGIIFLALGVAFLIHERRKREMKEELLSRGESVSAEVTGVSLNYSVSINGRHPYYVEASYRDPATGTVHVFRSHDLRFDPTEYVRGRKVAVYCRGDDYANYYMDIDAILPRVEMH